MQLESSHRISDWSEYQKLVLAELERHDQLLLRLGEFTSELKTTQVQLTAQMSDLTVSLKELTKELSASNKVGLETNLRLQSRLEMLAEKVGSLEEAAEKTRSAGDRWFDRLWSVFWAAIVALLSAVATQYLTGKK